MSRLALALLAVVLASAHTPEPVAVPVIESEPATVGRGARLVSIDLGGPLSAADVAAFNAQPERPARVPSTSLCGEPTKKGTPCRNKVRGGGPCWRHR